MFIDRIRIVCYIGTTYLGKYYTRAFYMYQMFCVPKNSVEGCQHFCCVRCFKPATCLLIILYIEQQREASEHIITLGSCGFAISVFWLYWILQCAFFSSCFVLVYPSIKYQGHACWIVSTELVRVGRWVIWESNQRLDILVLLLYRYIGWARRQNVDKLTELSVNHTYIHIAGTQAAALHI